MAGSVVQTRNAVNSLGAATVSDTITVSNKATICAHVGCDNAGGAITIQKVSDGVVYLLGDAKRADTGNNQFGTAYYRENVPAGTYTVVATAVGGTPGNMVLKLVELSGLVPLYSLETAGGQFQATPGTAANGVSSGPTGFATNATNFVIVFTQNTGEGFGSGTSGITAGSGYTKAGTEDYMAVESKFGAGAGAQTGTFTQSVAVARVSHTLVFREQVVPDPPTRSEFQGTWGRPRTRYAA